jgi:hypothetical protein
LSDLRQNRKRLRSADGSEALITIEQDERAELLE